MNVKWYQSESRNNPLEVDKQSTPSGVYIRKDITEVSEVDMYGESYVKFVYQEALLTHDEYQEYSIINGVTSAIELQHETDIIDNYTMQLIEEGLL